MKLINTINNIRYVTIEYFIYTFEGATTLQGRLKRHDGIVQSCHHYGGLFSKRYSIMTVLIPEINIIAFNKEVLSEV